MEYESELSELVPRMTPAERAIVDAILVGADTSGDGQMELVSALRSGCTLEDLVTAARSGV